MNHNYLDRLIARNAQRMAALQPPCIPPTAPDAFVKDASKAWAKMNANERAHFHLRMQQIMQRKD